MVVLYKKKCLRQIYLNQCRFVVFVNIGIMSFSCTTWETNERIN